MVEKRVKTGLPAFQKIKQKKDNSLVELKLSKSERDFIIGTAVTLSHSEADATSVDLSPPELDITIVKLSSSESEFILSDIFPPKNRNKKRLLHSSRCLPFSYEKRVFDALDNESYKYRTLDGIVKETDIQETEVLKIIRKNENKIVTLSRTTKDGRTLFASRKKYQEEASAAEKLMGVFLNRVY